MLSNATTTGAGASVTAPRATRTFQASGSTTSGSGAATIKIQVSNDEITWLDLGTITLTLGVAATGDGFASDAPWNYARANVTAISGTGASVNVSMGY